MFRVVWLTAVGVLAVAGFHVVVGWFMAHGLRRGALAVTDRPEPPGVWIREVGTKHLVLEADDVRQDVGHPGVIGLAWNGGYARAGEVTHVVDRRITRELLSIDREPPICPGAACEPVAIEGYAYPDSPNDVDLDYEPVTYKSPLGTMNAWRVPAAQPSHRWAILVHGWTAEKREMVRMLPPFHRQGYTSLVINYRNDPGHPEDPSGHHRFGLSEWEDLEAAVRYAQDHGATELVVGGASTGGAIALAALERSDVVREMTVGLFLDSPNAIMAETVRLATADSRATQLLIELGMWIADLRWKVDWAATNYVSRADQTITVPTLVFHGTADQTVPISVSRQLAARVPDFVELIEVPAAAHVMSWNADPSGYEKRLEAFLRRL